MNIKEKKRGTKFTKLEKIQEEDGEDSDQAPAPKKQPAKLFELYDPNCNKKPEHKSLSQYHYIKTLDKAS